MKAAATLGPTGGRSTRYNAPDSIVTIDLATLLAGTNRWMADSPPQLNFLRDLSGPKASDSAQIFASGDLSLVKLPCVSVIGTREVSPPGAARARRIARALVDHGIVVVSGLAAGVDTEAMTATVAAGGKTIGVIGTPLDKAYPSQNAALQETVYRDHLLLSQFAPGQKVWPSNFPQRNRLMAIISDATVVIEASDTSGTLHQAAECMKLGRWLFIVRSVVEDRSLTWPEKFLKYDTCVVLDDVADITSRILK